MSYNKISSLNINNIIEFINIILYRDKYYACFHYYTLCKDKIKITIFYNLHLIVGL